jgi:SAM-dependent methyltransferase
MKKKDGFSPEWENIYKSNIHLSIWPWTEVVSLVNLFCKNTKIFRNVLEIGCGAGANIPFFLSRAYRYYGIDGSKIIIDRLKKKFSIIKDQLIVSDFTQEILFNKKFDLIIDRGSLTHNTFNDVGKALQILSKKTRKGGIYIGVDLFSSMHTSSKLGKKIDSFTRSKINTPQFRNVGNVHFFTKESIIKLFKKNDFKILMLEHVSKKNLFKKKLERNCVFNMVAKKI